MKKIGLAVAVATALGATSAVVNAYTVGKYDDGLLVPYATFQGADEGTTVGLLSCAAGNVYWTFFDENSKHITDGTIKMTKNDMYSFLLNEEAGIGLEGVKGYLLFLLDSAGKEVDGVQVPDGKINTADADCLAGNAFYVDLAANDVAFIPTAPVDNRDLGHPNGEIDALTVLDNDSITRLKAGARWGEFIDMRYYIDNQVGGNDTSIVLWTVCKPPVVNTVDMYDADQHRKSVNFNLPNDELNVVDPETILGRPSDFLDGFIRWYVDAAEAPIGGGKAYCHHFGGPFPVGAFVEDKQDHDHQGALSFSVISAEAFGAAQTLYNPHQKDYSKMNPTSLVEGADVVE